MSSLTELQKLDAEFHLHPFTNHQDMDQAGTHVIASGDGVWVTDANGRKLLDGLAGLWCVNIGYGQRPVIDAIHRQLQSICFYPSFFNSTTEPTIRLAAALAEIAPARLNHTIFSNSGSEANETALKLIRGYFKAIGKPQKTKIVTRTFSYHGVTLATTSMTGLPSCYEPFDLPLPGYIKVPGPYHYGAATSLDAEAYGDWCLSETATILEKEDARTVAALFVEPIQGAGGVIVPPPHYLIKLRELCRKHDILFVADEVITGFGRLGAWFGSERLDPDMMTLAKGLTSGYIPMGATMVSDEMAEVLRGRGYLAHGFTYSGHPVAAAAGLANLAFIRSENLLEKVKMDIGPYFQSRLHEFAAHPAVGEVRGAGLLGALELVPPGGKSALRPGMLLGVSGAACIREEGAIVRGIRDLIAISPALIISRDEIDDLISRIGRGLDRFAASN